MIILNEFLIASEENVDEFIQHMRNNEYKEEHKKFTDIYHSFLLDCLRADERLQKMVYESLGEKYISFVILPFRDTDDLQSFSFQLGIMDEESRVKKRDEKIFRELCDICFGGVQPYYNRIVDFYESQ